MRPCEALRPAAREAGRRSWCASVSLPAVMAAGDRAAAADDATLPRTSPTCGSTDRCDGQLPTTDIGWVCRDVLVMGRVRIDGQLAPRVQRPGPKEGR